MGLETVAVNMHVNIGRYNRASVPVSRAHYKGYVDSRG
jgi:hypothetical protein